MVLKGTVSIQEFILCNPTTSSITVTRRSSHRSSLKSGIFSSRPGTLWLSCQKWTQRNFPTEDMSYDLFSTQTEDHTLTPHTLVRTLKTSRLLPSSLSFRDDTRDYTYIPRAVV